jgi:hypothetical protein
MDTTTATLIGLGILALVVIAFFAVFRGKGKFRIKTILGEATAEGENENPALPTTVAAGVKISGAQAGRDIQAHSTSAGGVDAENAKAGRNIDATHSPGGPPPKT